MLFTHFYLLSGEKIEAWLDLQQAGNTLALNPQLFCQQIDKKYPLVR